MTDKVKEFLQLCKEDLNKPVNEIDWVAFYDKANTYFDDLESIGEISALFLSKIKSSED